MWAKLLSRLRMQNASPVNMQSIRGMKDRPPLYQRYPPWWAQWAYALIAVDIIQTTSILDLTWNKWTVLDPTQNSRTTPKDEQRFVPQHASTRALVCFAHTAIGIGVATALLVARGRYIRTFTLVDTGKSQRSVFIQSAAHTGTKGFLFPLSRCQLHAGRNDAEIILRVDGERGHWFMNLFGAVVRGKHLEREKDIKDKTERQEWKEECAYAARYAIVKEWGNGKKVGEWHMNELGRKLGMKQRMRAMEEKATSRA